MSSDVMSRIMAVTASHRLMSQKDKGKFKVFANDYLRAFALQFLNFSKRVFGLVLLRLKKSHLVNVRVSMLMFPSASSVDHQSHQRCCDSCNCSWLWDDECAFAPSASYVKFRSSCGSCVNSVSKHKDS